MMTQEQKQAEYVAFLKRKMPRAEKSGFTPPSPPDASLKPHQRDIATWACLGGRRAIFANFGLGKTRIHLQLAKWVHEQTGGRHLIVAPLGVRQEFTLSDGPAMGMDIQYVRTNEEVLASTSPYLITNYERVRDGDITLDNFAGAGLDEASCLRSYGSKTYQSFLNLFQSVPFRFVFTATPSPNRHKELIHYGGFLGIMDTGEALTRFFQRNSEKANDLTLYPHMEQQFWYWLSTWAAFLQKPSELGHSDEGYDMPEMQVHWHKVEIDHTKAWNSFDGWGQRQLFRDDAQGLKAGAEVKRDTIVSRLAKAMDIMDGEDASKHWILWHDLEAEREQITKSLKARFPAEDFRIGYGTQDLEIREKDIMDFSRGNYRIRATKPILEGSGCNYQRHCADAIFLGVGYKFNDFIQACHRIFRFLQTKTVNIHIIYSESESSIMETLRHKWRQHDLLMDTMSELLTTHKLTNLEL